MFQRIKGAIDSRIAEEQARAKAATTSPARNAPNALRRSISSRNESPSKKARARSKEVDDGARGLDPAVFEGAFVIEDDSEEPSRVGTPVPDSKAEMANDNGATTETRTSTESEVVDGKADVVANPPASTELPAEVRSKLRKLDKLESRYQELLRSYRIAHTRAISIEPFEKTLKENTPLVSISEPGAFVEYLNQLTLKGDMVMDELKRVTNDRDECKKKFEEAQKEITILNSVATRSSLEESGEILRAPSMETLAGSADLKPSSTKSPVSSVLGLFSPKQNAQAVADVNQDTGENFFSYDDEIPQLQSDLKAKTVEIDQLKEEVKALEGSLGAAKQTNGSLAESLQSVERQLSEAKDLDKESAQTDEKHTLQESLETTTKALQTMEVKYSKMEKDAKDALDSKAAALNNSKELSQKLIKQITELRALKDRDEARIMDLEQLIGVRNDKLELLEAEKRSLEASSKTLETQTTSIDQPNPGDTPLASNATSKKKNKKKKKGPSASKDASEKKENVDEGEVSFSSSGNVELFAEISKLKEEIVARDLQIDKLQSKRKIEGDLQEEIENMQENLLTIGQEHVDAKVEIKQLRTEKEVLQERVNRLENEATAQKNRSISTERVELELKEVTVEYEDLKTKFTTLQVDLGAARQLATSRYKDLTELRDILQKAQPELKNLRSENASLKNTREELATRTAELRRLEGRERDLKADLSSFKKQAADRETEIKSLNDKVNLEMNSRLKAEDQCRVAGRDLRRVEADKIELSATSEKAQRESNKLQNEATKLRTTVQELEIQVSKLTTDNQGLREEVDLKSSQYKNAQSLVGSMRDQTSEMATQLKEAKEQAESLEEELTEVQKLLTERTREGETMRRLLSDVDERADNKVREMRERMEAAIEERDCAEDEASTNGRRRAREIEDLKNKIRDAERDLKRAADDRDELLHSEKDWKRRREELEKASERAAQEVSEINKALEELRDALDKSEKQAREAEKQKMDLRRLLDDSNQKYEKLQKLVKSKQQRLDEFAPTPSSRSSTDRDASPMRPPNGTANGMMDHVYLKTVLLQFLEQKDKKLQGQLVPVLGKLLHFDKKDEQKWIAAISAR